MGAHANVGVVGVMGRGCHWPKQLSQNRVRSNGARHLVTRLGHVEFRTPE